MVGRLNLSVLALAITFAGSALTGFALNRSAAQTPGASSSHSEGAESSTSSASPAPQPQPVPQESRKTSKKAGGPELPGPAQEAETSLAGGPVPNSELETYIENSLKGDPSLSGARVRVAVLEDRIELTGNVAKAKEKQTAGRLAQSFAGNKKLVNEISIGAPATSQTPGGQTSPKAKPQDPRTTPSLNAQPNEAVPRP